MWRIKAYPKINIGLNVSPIKIFQKKHEIKTLIMLIHDYCDEITVVDSSSLNVEYFDKNHKRIVIENDIVTQTLYFLKRQFGIEINYKITIYKNIPMRAGLGGSSTDAGAIIRLLKSKLNLIITKKHLKIMALELGSDIPFFVSDFTLALVSGYGHKIKHIQKQLPFYELIPVAKIDCATENIYKQFDLLPKPSKTNNFKKITKSLPNLKHCIISNNLQDAAIICYPELKHYADKGYIMTGSGSFFVNYHGGKYES